MAVISYPRLHADAYNHLQSFALVAPSREQQASLVSAFGSIVSLLLVYLFIPHVPKKKQVMKLKLICDKFHLRYFLKGYA